MFAPSPTSTRAVLGFAIGKRDRHLRLHVGGEDAGLAHRLERGQETDVGDQHAPDAVGGRSTDVLEGVARHPPARGSSPRRRAPPSVRAVADGPHAAVGWAKRLTSTRASAASPDHLVELVVGQEEATAALRDALDRDLAPRRLVQDRLQASRPLGARDLEAVVRAVREAVRRIGEGGEVSGWETHRREERPCGFHSREG